MIFRLSENSGEELNTTVDEVVEEIGGKPRVEACRAGQKKTDTRPVRVIFPSSAVVDRNFFKAIVSLYCKRLT